MLERMVEYWEPWCGAPGNICRVCGYIILWLLTCKLHPCREPSSMFWKVAALQDQGMLRTLFKCGWNWFSFAHWLHVVSHEYKTGEPSPRPFAPRACTPQSRYKAVDGVTNIPSHRSPAFKGWGICFSLHGCGKQIQAQRKSNPVRKVHLDFWNMLLHKHLPRHFWGSCLQPRKGASAGDKSQEPIKTARAQKIA